MKFQRPAKINRNLFYLGTFLSGFASLVYQVVWQRYLAILIGSEAKSSAIVISIFLVGLSAGYFAFGKLMEKNWSRRFSLKIYGYVELIIALYAISFPMLFTLFKKISFSGPNNILFDIAIVSLCLLLPTFLMGASIPVLTKVLPESPEEINHTHSQIYGWNTLGACLGVLLGGFFLLPHYGLPWSMLTAGGVNLLLSFIFLSNNLQGEAHKKQPVPPIPSKLKPIHLYSLVFIVGLATICFEVILLRLVGLAIGSSNIVFPTVLSIFIFALGLGSLRLPKLQNSDGIYTRLITILVLWFLVFLSVPFWGIWAAHIKVSLAILPSNYYVLNILMLVFFSFFIFPPVYFMGQILPLSFAFLDKSGKDYGKKCGYLYSLNTLGTAVGGIVLGYLLLYILDLDSIFRLNLLLLGFLTAGLCFVENHRRLVILSLCLSFAAYVPKWNRVTHHVGFFRDSQPTDEYFKGLFHLPPESVNNLIHYSDGPNTSISMTGYIREKAGHEKDIMEDIDLDKSVSVLVNGKSDGDTMGDFSNMYISGVVPYFLSPKQSDLKVAKIGFGTGLSVGALANSQDVSQIDLIEISSELLKFKDLTEGSNFSASNNEKTKFINTDAFRFFTRTAKKYDVIISEPSNPWVTGVENLYSLDFVQLCHDRLNDNGLLGLWFQNYNSDNSIVSTILASAISTFPFYRVYQVGSGDSLIILSKKSLEAPFMEKRMNETFHNKILGHLKLVSPADFTMLESLNRYEVVLGAHKNSIGIHSLEFPRLSDQSNKFRFIHSRAEPEKLLEEHFRFITRTHGLKYKQAFDQVMIGRERFFNCPKAHGFKFYCEKMKPWIVKAIQYQQQSTMEIGERVSHYLALRSRGFTEKNETLVKEVTAELAKLLSSPDPIPPWTSPFIGHLYLEGLQRSTIEMELDMAQWHPSKVATINHHLNQGEEFSKEVFKVTPKLFKKMDAGQ